MNPYRESARPPSFEEYPREPRSRVWCWLGQHVPVLIVIDGTVKPLTKGVEIKARSRRTRFMLTRVEARCLYCSKSWFEIYSRNYKDLEDLAKLYGPWYSKYRQGLLGLRWD